MYAHTLPSFAFVRRSFVFHLQKYEQSTHKGRARVCVGIGKQCKNDQNPADSKSARWVYPFCSNAANLFRRALVFFHKIYFHFS